MPTRMPRAVALSAWAGVELAQTGGVPGVLNRIANPDTLVLRDTGDVIIAEDSSRHRNAAIWRWWPA